jgi:hypothetical protein
MWCGAVLQSELRYFDPVSRRAGLPEGVAALVTRIEPESVTVTLVNVNQTAPRKIAVQAGAYGEHTCERVAVGGRTIDVNAPWFETRLEPGAGAQITMFRKRFTNRPTYDFPWNRGGGRLR